MAKDMLIYSYIFCPHCNYSFTLEDEDGDDDTMGLKPYEAVSFDCNNCEKDFRLFYTVKTVYWHTYKIEG